MSYSALDWALPKVIMDVNAKSCLVVLAYHHNGDTGLCCPSISKIAEKMGVKSLNTVRKAIKTLEEMKLLKLERVFGEHGEIASTRYTLNLQSNDYLPVPKKKGVVHVVKEVHNVKGAQEMNDGGSPREEGVVHVVKEGASYREGGVVHHVNPNKEIEQVIEQVKGTRNVVPAPASDDLFDEPVQMVEKQKHKKQTADRGSRLNIEKLPDDWKAFAEAEEPDLDPYRLFDNFKDYWTSVSGAKAIKKDWTATWRNFVRSFNNAPDWKRRPMLKNGVNPNRKPTDPQYGIGVCQPIPEEEVHWLTDEERAESRRQMEAEGYAPF